MNKTIEEAERFAELHYLSFDGMIPLKDVKRLINKTTKVYKQSLISKLSSIDKLRHKTKLGDTISMTRKDYEDFLELLS